MKIIMWFGCESSNNTNKTCVWILFVKNIFWYIIYYTTIDNVKNKM